MNEAIIEQCSELLKARERGIVICVEGNIAVGKTTLVKDLKEELSRQMPSVKIQTVSETIDEKILEDFNIHPESFAYKIQIYMMYQRINAMKLAQMLIKEGIIVIMDTGILREFAFRDANYNIGNLTEIQWSTLAREFTVEHEKFGAPFPDIIVMLHCTPEKCLENIKSRNRLNETVLSLKYITEINTSYNKALMNLTAHINSQTQIQCDIIYIDVTNVFAKSLNLFQRICNSFILKKEVK